MLLFRDFFVISWFKDINLIQSSCKICKIFFYKVPGFQTVAYPIEASVSRRGEVVQTATLGLDRRVTREDLNNNNASLNIKCVASIYTAYYKTVELQASLRIRKKLKRRRENLKKKQQKDKDNQNGKLRTHSSIKMYSIYFPGDAIQLVSPSASPSISVTYLFKVLSMTICLFIWKSCR